MVSRCYITTYGQSRACGEQDTAIPLRNLQHASDGRFSPEPLVLARTQERGAFEMRSIVTTIHTFDHSYAGISASEIQSPACNHIFLPRRRARKLFISETENRPLRSARLFPGNRDNSNFNLN